MKEILFRIWNGQEMVHDVTIGKFGVFYVNPGSNSDGLDENDNASLTQYNTKYPDNIPVMQFTGLTDKSGVNIFEGDICRDSEGKYMVVSWSKKFASWVLNRKGWAFSHWFGESCNPEDVEVVGNIYDNPELLNP